MDSGYFLVKIPKGLGLKGQYCDDQSMLSTGHEIGVLAQVGCSPSCTTVTSRI